MGVWGVGQHSIGVSDRRFGDSKKWRLVTVGLSIACIVSYAWHHDTHQKSGEGF